MAGPTFDLDAAIAAGLAANGTNGHAEPTSGSKRGLAILQQQWAEKEAVDVFEGQLIQAAVHVRRSDPERDRDGVIEDLGACGLSAPAHLHQEEIAGIVARVVDGAFEHIPQKKSSALVIPWESFDGALLANEAYLTRIPVVDKLCYSSAVSMITGGKHAGKSTLARWLSICVAKGMKFLQREVVQGPVVYIASEDETMAARQELLHLGWGTDDPIKFLPAGAVGVTDRVKLLEAIARDIKAAGVVLVVFDMLFDFVNISNEMSYAETSAALLRIQDVASVTGAHVIVTHHAPKHSQTGDAGVTALGSQGLAAKVSPIILVRRFGPGVHSVVSTSVRDPRGEALSESRLLRHEDGSVTLGGAWKTYMLADAYMPRILEFLDAEDGAEVTAGDVTEGLDVPYPVVRACLTNLYRGGVLLRFGDGKKGRPFRYSKRVHGTNDVPNNSPPDTGPFGYKDN